MQKKKTIELEEPFGANSELLTVRIPLSLLEGLEAMASGGGGSVPVLVRRLLWYHLAPAVIKQSVRRLQTRDISEVTRLEDYAVLIDGFKEETERLSKSLRGMQKIQERVHAQEKAFAAVEDTWRMEVSKLLEELDEVAEAIETSETEQEQEA